MKNWFSRNLRKGKGKFSRPIERSVKLFEEPRKLWVVFSLRLSLVLCLATIIPVLLLFLLSKLDLIEASYGIDTEKLLEIDPDFPLEHPIPDTVPLPATPTLGDEVGEIAEGPAEPLPMQNDRIPISFDPVSGVWQLSYDLSNVVFVSSIFNFHVGVPAWIAIGALPFLSLFVGVLLSVWMSRSVTRPFSQLAAAAHAIGKRDLKYRVQTGGSQELQDLAQSFNRMAEQLEQAETIRRNLTADVAHELRTPLTVLDGNLRAILDGVHEMNEEEIALLYEQTHHLNRLVDDLRELSLAEADQLSLDCQEVDIGRVVKETVAHFDLLAREQDIQLSTRLDDPLVHPCLDENRIRQVLHNLLSNAFRYTPRGGNVAISAKRSAHDHGVEIKVADSGAGMSSKELLRIFDRFYRSAETAGRELGGSGLGLTIVKALVEALGGTIRAESAGKDQGSTFTVAFPPR